MYCHGCYSKKVVVKALAQQANDSLAGGNEKLES